MSDHTLSPDERRAAITEIGAAMTAILERGGGGPLAPVYVAEYEALEHRRAVLLEGLELPPPVHVGMDLARGESIGVLAILGPGPFEERVIGVLEGQITMPPPPMPDFTRALEAFSVAQSAAMRGFTLSIQVHAREIEAALQRLGDAFRAAAAGGPTEAFDRLWWAWLTPAQRRRYCKRLIRETIAARRMAAATGAPA